jgi:hypothetical protein
VALDQLVLDDPVVFIPDDQLSTLGVRDCEIGDPAGVL